MDFCLLWGIFNKKIMSKKSFKNFLLFAYVIFFFFFVNFMWVCLCIGAPHSGDVLELWAYNGLICNLTDTCMFSFDVSFDKTQPFISVWADSVYMCVEIYIGGHQGT